MRGCSILALNVDDVIYGPVASQARDALNLKENTAKTVTAQVTFRYRNVEGRSKLAFAITVDDSGGSYIEQALALRRQEETR